MSSMSDDSPILLDHGNHGYDDDDVDVIQQEHDMRLVRLLADSLTENLLEMYPLGPEDACSLLDDPSLIMTSSTDDDDNIMTVSSSSWKSQIPLWTNDLLQAVQERRPDDSVDMHQIIINQAKEYGIQQWQTRAQQLQQQQEKQQQQQLPDESEQVKQAPAMSLLDQLLAGNGGALASFVSWDMIDETAPNSLDRLRLLQKVKFVQDLLLDWNDHIQPCLLHGLYHVEWSSDYAKLHVDWYDQLRGTTGGEDNSIDELLAQLDLCHNLITAITAVGGSDQQQQQQQAPLFLWLEFGIHAAVDMLSDLCFRVGGNTGVAMQRQSALMNAGLTLLLDWCHQPWMLWWNNKQQEQQQRELMQTTDHDCIAATGGQFSHIMIAHDPDAEWFRYWVRFQSTTTILFRLTSFGLKKDAAVEEPTTTPTTTTTTTAVTAAKKEDVAEQSRPSFVTVLILYAGLIPRVNADPLSRQQRPTKSSASLMPDDTYPNDDQSMVLQPVVQSDRRQRFALAVLQGMLHRLRVAYFPWHDIIVAIQMAQGIQDVVDGDNQTSSSSSSLISGMIAMTEWYCAAIEQVIVQQPQPIAVSESRFTIDNDEAVDMIKNRLVIYVDALDILLWGCHACDKKVELNSSTTAFQTMLQRVQALHCHLRQFAAASSSFLSSSLSPASSNTIATVSGYSMAALARSLVKRLIQDHNSSLSSPSL